MMNAHVTTTKENRFKRLFVVLLILNSHYGGVAAGMEKAMG